MAVHRQSLGIWDYAVIMCSFAVSFAIGVVFHYAGRRRYTAQNFFMAGNNMSKFPVVLSIVVTNLSAILMLGAPAEVYRYGTQIVLLTLGMTAGIILASYLILPIYFDLRITTVYEYLEMRYGKFIRYTVSSLFIVQTLLYISVVLYAPALALSAVADLSTEMSIILMGVVCTLYCSIGGLKAVLWTDVFQSGLMSACIAIVFIKGVTEVGGLGEVLHRSSTGGRLEFF
ncbi:sodium-coupled monocarboxylate transporter 1-like, partial [Stegodyphus dumicola]|uniref:sodium-coupled monocarboxylate transporter 1-like n=1 Tax=Stegodyphus dumicola TaxID=202533 RepID=UPI0015AF3114